jgi:hypothetical protein
VGAFPEARYIFLIRDGRAVASSLTKSDWWNDDPLWWAEDKTAHELMKEGVHPLSIAAQNWVQEVRAIKTGFQMVPREQIKVARYEDILKDPIVYLRDLLKFMGVNMSAGYEEVVRGISIRVRRDDWGSWSQSELDRVLRIEGKVLQDLGYAITQ